MTIKIRANEKLFRAWSTLGLEVRQLANIVQNDMELETQEVELFLERIDLLKKKMDALKAETSSYLFEDM